MWAAPASAPAPAHVRGKKQEHRHIYIRSVDLQQRHPGLCLQSHPKQGFQEQVLVHASHTSARLSLNTDRCGRTEGKIHRCFHAQTRRGKRVYIRVCSVHHVTKRTYSSRTSTTPPGPVKMTSGRKRTNTHSEHKRSAQESLAVGRDRLTPFLFR